MKRFLSVRFFLIFLIGVFLDSPAVAQEAPAPAAVVLKEAYRQAAKENKKVFLIFHASWCGWCHKMDTAMNDPRVRQFFIDHYVIRHLSVDEHGDKKQLENPGAADTRKRLGGTEDDGIPYWVVLDAKGKLLADGRIGSQPGKNTGCPATEEEVAHFLNVLKRTSPLDATALDVIRTTFRENERRP
ncbi:thioredoxin family protein [Paraflavisolibacter sp. H34]|uniref:thioredoxin family protein n=1 Tax=Huijunlia imazamoxiresistens TaxID=3127457 RepID=UPI00301A4566